MRRKLVKDEEEVSGCEFFVWEVGLALGAGKCAAEDSDGGLEDLACVDVVGRHDVVWEVVYRATYHTTQKERSQTT